MKWILAASLLLGIPAANAQALNDPVVASPDPEALFTSPDPKLNANKQAAYKNIKELIEAGHWERAPLYLTERYIQHNPNAASGRDGVVHYFVDIAKVKPRPIPEKMQTRVVAVTAEGDLVTVSFVREAKDPRDPSKTYTTTWFDMWRFKDGKADEHWDPATLPPAAPPAAASADDILREAQDRVAIGELMFNYERALDSFNPDAYAQTYVPDGSFGATKGRDALWKMLADLKKNQDERRAKGEALPAMHHFMTNEHIEFVDRDHARLRYYWMTVFAGPPEQPPRVAAAGRGVDELVRVGGKWLIQSRNVNATD
jgi:predicted SnoaL-like aldol condensation-catalyzing enzyme